MKEAIMLIIVLLMGLFVSQSFGAYFTTQDEELLDTMYDKIDYIYDQDIEHLVHISSKMPLVIKRFSNNSKDLRILTELDDYINNKLYTAEVNNVSTSVIDAWADLF